MRRFATDVVERAGVDPAIAAGFISHLLWFDSAGLGRFGLAMLHDWLGLIESGQIAPNSRGRFLKERAGTALFDAQRGLPPVMLARAGEVALEKARDVGVGLVRVQNLGPAGPALGVAAELSVGPVVAAVLGPGPRWSLAIPSADGLPVLFESSLRGPATKGTPPEELGALAPWAGVLAPEQGWLILAVSVHAFEPLEDLQRRASGHRPGGSDDGWIDPASWEKTRRECRERGIPLGRDALKQLERLAKSYSVPLPERTDA